MLTRRSNYKSVQKIAPRRFLLHAATQFPALILVHRAPLHWELQFLTLNPSRFAPILYIIVR